MRIGLVYDLRSEYLTAGYSEDAVAEFDSEETFDVKEKCESCVSYEALQPGTLRDDIEALALNAYRALECRDAGRVDIRLDRHDQPAFMGVNPLPGLHPTHSDLPMIATQEGLSYDALIGAIVSSAEARIPCANAVPCPEPAS